MGDLSPDCERALPLIALERDGELDADSNEAGWLGEHLMHCRSCRVRRDATAATAQVGADRSQAISQPRTPRHRGRDFVLIGALAILLVIAVLVAVSNEGPLGLVVRAAEEVPAAAAPEPEPTAPEPAAPEPEGARAGKKAAGKKGCLERSQQRCGGRERSGQEPGGLGPGGRGRGGPGRSGRERGGRERSRHEQAGERGTRGSEPRQPESGRRDRGGAIADPPSDGPERDSAAPHRKLPVERGRIERRPDRGAQEELVPVPAPVPPPTETTPAPPAAP